MKSDFNPVKQENVTDGNYDMIGFCFTVLTMIGGTYDLEFVDL